MKTSIVVTVMVVAVGLTLYLTGWAGPGAGLGGSLPLAYTGGDAVATADVTPAQVTLPTLTVGLNPSLNEDGVEKATSITSAKLKRGTTIIQASIVNGEAVFDMTGLMPGWYTIIINGLATDMIPTRIADPTIPIRQWVSTTLRNSVIGSTVAPKVKFKTWSVGQGDHTTVKYTDGTAAAPTQYAYMAIFMTMTPKKYEIRRLGTNQLLLSDRESEHSVGTWLWGPTSHGTRSPSTCSGCHGSTSSKPASYGSISKSNGWCYKCHYGSTGAGNGFVHPAQ